ncbi:transporter substrate-binding domain-containing protein [Paraglaciecola aquimarina]|uniref:Transporter substrate-binding domain-containing protein n=1 Tax=Paraglaciecola aquimarina TaxID=1235557 RepID=A0ABU3SZI5_9ALTE|nr:transporter substrate-binding domain-containing protein [Paraglaciecola aquimarina]MDU0355332.1 transporter substrate-binding domain-containing protein [Paraglaciecola aquimarina]
MDTKDNKFGFYNAKFATACCVALLAYMPANKLYANDLTIQLASTDWCPYTCANDISNRGIVHDYVEYIFSQKDIALKVSSFPWARAIRQVEGGKLDGLLTAVPAKGRNLIYTEIPIMSYQMCFFGAQDSQWQYKNQDSLRDVRLGVIAEYSYGEPVDTFVKNKHKTGNVIELNTRLAIQQLISLVAAGRIDVLIEDKNVMDWHLKNTHHSLLDQFKNLGCLQESPFYLAMSPKINWSYEVIDFLNRAFESEDNQQLLYDDIVGRY